MNKRTWLGFLIAMVFVLGIIVGAVGVYAQDSVRIPPLPAGNPYQPNQGELSLADVYNRVSRSVVNVSVAVDGSGFQPGGAGTGSGFVIDTQGHIVTNNHVVDDASYIEVTFIDGTIVTAELVGRDPYADLAVIQVDPSEVELQPLTFADSDLVFVGQQVMAIGSPFGEEQAFTLTTGIVSALDRSLASESRFSIPELIQTDAAINPGNSGGPLLDMAGNVIGVNTAILSGSNSASGVGFSIPANTVRRIVPYLIQNSSYEHTWMGISGMTLRPDQREAMNLPPTLRGILVTEVVEGGPAAGAGLIGSTDVIQVSSGNASGVIQTPFGDLPVKGDVIMAINSTGLSTMNDLIAYLEDNTLPGDTVTLSIVRDGQTMDVAVTLQERPSLPQ